MKYEINFETRRLENISFPEKVYNGVETIELIHDAIVKVLEERGMGTVDGQIHTVISGKASLVPR